MAIVTEKRITQVMRESEEYYGGKAARGLGRVLASERGRSNALPARDNA